jgi:hypothetical protein
MPHDLLFRHHSIDHRHRRFAVSVHAPRSASVDAASVDAASVDAAVIAAAQPRVP